MLQRVRSRTDDTNRLPRRGTFFSNIYIYIYIIKLPYKQLPYNIFVTQWRKVRWAIFALSRIKQSNQLTCVRLDLFIYFSSLDCVIYYFRKDSKSAIDDRPRCACCLEPFLVERGVECNDCGARSCRKACCRWDSNDDSWFCLFCYHSRSVLVSYFLKLTFYLFFSSICPVENENNN